MRLLVIGVLAFLLAVLAVTAQERATAAPEDGEQLSRVRAGISSQPGEQRTVSVGDIALEEFSVREYAWAILSADTLASSSHNRVLKKGHRLWGLGEGEVPSEFCTHFEHSRYCFRDRDADGRFDEVSILGGGRPRSGLRARYQVVWLEASGDETGFRRELVFLGAGGGLLKFAFRERSGEAVTLSSEVTFDRSPGGPTIIAVRGARLEVLEAGNEGIRYRVLSGFGEAKN